MVWYGRFGVAVWCPLRVCPLCVWTGDGRSPLQFTYARVLMLWFHGYRLLSRHHFLHSCQVPAGRWEEDGRCSAPRTRCKSANLPA